MAEIIELEDQIEKVILVGVSEQDGDDAEDSVAELAELVRTAGAVVVGTLIQKRELMPGHLCGHRKSGGDRGDDRRAGRDRHRL